METNSSKCAFEHMREAAFFDFMQAHPASDPSLSPDCSQCEALCCVLLPFDASDAFAFDKPAGAPCRHLAMDYACTIHAGLAGQGFKGCAAYSCHGAGQRITGQVFAGRSWRRDPNLLPAMEDAFRSLRKLHEAAALLTAAARLALSPTQQARAQELLAALDLSRDWTEAALRAAETGPVLKDIRAFLTSLRDVVALTPPHR